MSCVNALARREAIYGQTKLNPEDYGKYPTIYQYKVEQGIRMRKMLSSKLMREDRFNSIPGVYIHRCSYFLFDICQN